MKAWGIDLELALDLPVESFVGPRVLENSDVGFSRLFLPLTEDSYWSKEERICFLAVRLAQKAEGFNRLPKTHLITDDSTAGLRELSFLHPLNANRLVWKICEAIV